MSINPVLKNEMKLMGRSRQMVIIVTSFNLIMSVAILLIFDSINMMSQTSGGSPWMNVNLMFAVIITLQICMLTLFVPPIAGGSIAGEFERQTMDILLSSRMSAKNIIWGKLLSSVSLALLLMVSCLPVDMMMMTYGGLTLPMMAGPLLFSAFFAFFAGCIGIFWSCHLRRTTGATIATYGMILFLTVGILALELVTRMLFGEFAGIWFIVYILCYLQLLNPAVTFSAIVVRIFSGSDIIRWLSEGLSVPLFITEHWILLSVCAQIIFSVILIIFSVKRLDPIKKRR